jgi:hypothetical protein
MKKIITIALILIATTSFAQSKTSISEGGSGTSARIDTSEAKAKSNEVRLDTPLLTLEDINKLNLVIMKQFDLTEGNKYDAIVKELQALIKEATERRKKK